LRPHSLKTTLILDRIQFRSHSFYATLKWSCFDLLWITFLWSTFYFFAGDPKFCKATPFRVQGDPRWVVNALALWNTAVARKLLIPWVWKGALYLWNAILLDQVKESYVLRLLKSWKCRNFMHNHDNVRHWANIPCFPSLAIFIVALHVRWKPDAGFNSLASLKKTLPFSPFVEFARVWTLHSVSVRDSHRKPCDVGFVAAGAKTLREADRSFCSQSFVSQWRYWVLADRSPLRRRPQAATVSIFQLEVDGTGANSSNRISLAEKQLRFSEVRYHRATRSSLECVYYDSWRNASTKSLLRNISAFAGCNYKFV